MRFKLFAYNLDISPGINQEALQCSRISNGNSDYHKMLSRKKFFGNTAVFDYSF